MGPLLLCALTFGDPPPKGGQRSWGSAGLLILISLGGGTLLNSGVRGGQLSWGLGSFAPLPEGARAVDVKKPRRFRGPLPPLVKGKGA
jgi:hypothetical protein